MGKILACWIGATDLRAASGDVDAGLGPIGQAVKSFEFDTVILLNNYPEEKVSVYLPWIKALSNSVITVFQKSLTSPMNFGEIYEAATSVLVDIAKQTPELELFLHLSPGTPAMAAVWIILAKTRFPASLIESSKEHGARIASVPFDISAEFIPDLLRGPDRRLESLSSGIAPQAPEFSDIIHRSEVMKRLIAKARKVAPRSVPVLIEGESGTGKELLARAIHRASTRNDRPFIAVNCGAIPSELVEPEMFGHEKGAFTGADSRRIGYFEAAQGGTVFLDEVGELPLRAQVKLLRTLQEGEIVRVGSTKPVKVDFRIIAATNRSLTDEKSRGMFRSDLFYRIAVAVLQAPPVRDRPGDLSLLVEKLWDQVNAESKGEPGFVQKELSAGARNLLLAHGWPGNVRELLNTLRRAAIWSDGSVVGSEDIREALLPVQSGSDHQILNRPIGEGFDLAGLLALVARHYLTRAMEQAGGNKTQAADILGLPSYQTLTNWLKKFRVDQ